jgi:hypothetical protein
VKKAIEGREESRSRYIVMGACNRTSFDLKAGDKLWRLPTIRAAAFDTFNSKKINLR